MVDVGKELYTNGGYAEMALVQKNWVMKNCCQGFMKLFVLILIVLFTLWQFCVILALGLLDLR